MAGLIIISNDLARAHRHLDDEIHSSGEEAHQAPYWFMLAVSHLREAVKFLDAETCDLVGTEEVQSFIARLPDESRELLEDVVGEFQPWEKSWMRVLGKPLRDRLFHYTGSAQDGTDYTAEIGDALGAMKDLTRSVNIRGPRILDWHWFFGEEVRLYWMEEAAGLTPYKLLWFAAGRDLSSGGYYEVRGPGHPCVSGGEAGGSGGVTSPLPVFIPAPASEFEVGSSGA